MCALESCSPAAGLAVKCRVLHSVGKDQLNERSMKKGLQEVNKDDPVKSEERKAKQQMSLGYRIICSLDSQFVSWLLLPLCLFWLKSPRRGNSLDLPFRNLLKRRSLLCSLLLMQGSSSPQDQGNLSRAPLKMFQQSTYSKVQQRVVTHPWGWMYKIQQYLEALTYLASVVAYSEWQLPSQLQEAIHGIGVPGRENTKPTFSPLDTLNYVPIHIFGPK